MAARSRKKNRPKGGRPRPGGGRVTPKGGHRSETRDRPRDRDGTTDWAAESARYTAPTPAELGSSPTWWPALMFGLMGLGMLLIIANYTGMLPGTPNNWMLLPAVACIGGGLFAAMNYR